MNRLSLTPDVREIVVNGATADGSVDLFTYGPDEPAAGALGSLYVIGSHSAESTTMDYMVSLVAAMARREYYAHANAIPKEAFSAALRKVNEVVEEFFRSDGISLAIGIVAIAGGTIMVSKLDKFRILLAREGEVMDILNNVALFSKEHVDQRRFSSIIHGSVQPGDRLLAYIPTKSIGTKERSLKMWLGKNDSDAFVDQCTKLGEKNTAFSAALLHIDIQQVTHAPAPVPQTPVHMAPEMPEPVVARAPERPPVVHAWAPRQAAAPTEPEPAPSFDEEAPKIIPTEFSRGIRQNSLTRIMSGLRLVRLDGRGKAAVIGGIAVVVIAAALVMKSMLFVSPEEQKLRAALTDIQSDLHQAQESANEQPGQARSTLVRALATLASYQQGNKQVSNLTADILKTMDTLDNAEVIVPTAIATLDADTDYVALATWASPSYTLWAVTSDGEALAAARIDDGEIVQRIPLPDQFTPTLITGWKDGVLVMDGVSRSLVRISGGTIKEFSLPTQETPLDMAVFNNTLYVLTNQSILKVADLDTNKPVTTTWLTDAADLAPQAARILVDGNIYTFSRDGVLATYFKGKRTTSTPTGIAPTGSWRFTLFTGGNFAIASADRTRVYIIAPNDGILIRTLTVDSEQPFLLMAPGKDNSILAVSKDNRLWEIK